MIPRINIEPIRIPETEIPRIPPTRIFDAAPPIVDSLKPPVIDIPSGEIPSYKPIEIPMSPPSVNAPEPKSGRDGQGEEEGGRSGLDAPSVPKIPPTNISEQQPRIEIPLIGYELPVPSSNEVALAGTTAVAATGAALLGKSLVEQLLKVFKPVARKLMLQAKAAMKRDLTPYELQMYFEFEGKEKLTKLLEKEQRHDRLVQAEEWAMQQQRQHTPMHTESQDEIEFQTSELHHTEEA